MALGIVSLVGCGGSHSSADPTDSTDEPVVDDSRTTEADEIAARLAASDAKLAALADKLADGRKGSVHQVVICIHREGGSSATTVVDQSTTTTPNCVVPVEEAADAGAVVAEEEVAEEVVTPTAGIPSGFVTADDEIAAGEFTGRHVNTSANAKHFSGSAAAAEMMDEGEATEYAYTDKAAYQADLDAQAFQATERAIADRAEAAEKYDATKPAEAFVLFEEPATATPSHWLRAGIKQANRKAQARHNAAVRNGVDDSHEAFSNPLCDD